MIGRRNILAMLGMAPVAAASAGVENFAPAGTTTGSLNRLASCGMSGSSLFKDVFSDHEELDRKKNALNALKQLRAAGYRNENHYYEGSENIASRRATSPAIKQLLQQEHRERMEIARREADVDNFTIRMLLPQSIKDWL